tara:strand:+ start:294 stop:494 length:201 start_codon:yes stop_codon:yes gene_type:complete
MTASRILLVSRIAEVRILGYFLFRKVRMGLPSLEGMLPLKILLKLGCLIMFTVTFGGDPEQFAPVM